MFMFLAAVFFAGVSGALTNDTDGDAAIVKNALKNRTRTPIQYGAALGALASHVLGRGSGSSETSEEKKIVYCDTQRRSSCTCGVLGKVCEAPYECDSQSSACKVPVACTADVHTDCVCGTGENNGTKKTCTSAETCEDHAADSGVCKPTPNGTVAASAPVAILLAMATYILM